MTLHKLVAVLSCGLMSGIASWALTSAIPPRYEAQAQITYQFPQIARETSDVLRLATRPRAEGSPDALLPSEAVRAGVARATARRLGESDYERIGREVELRILGVPMTLPGTSGSTAIEVGAAAPSATRARRLASSFAAAYVEYRGAAMEVRFANLRRFLTFQRSVARAERDTATRARLRGEIALAEQLGTLERANASVLRSTAPAVVKTAPHPWRDAGVAALIGVLLALLLKRPTAWTVASWRSLGIRSPSPDGP